MFENVIFPKGGILGSLRRARRVVNVKNGTAFKAQANRKHRSAVRQALKTEGQNLKRFQPATAWGLS